MSFPWLSIVKCLRGGWRWSPRGLSYCPPRSVGLESNLPSLIGLNFLLEEVYVGRRGCCVGFCFFFSRVRPRVAFLVSGEYLWKGREDLGFDMSCVPVIYCEDDWRDE